MGVKASRRGGGRAMEWIKKTRKDGIFRRGPSSGIVVEL